MPKRTTTDATHVPPPRRRLGSYPYSPALRLAALRLLGLLASRADALEPRLVPLLLSEPGAADKVASGAAAALEESLASLANDSPARRPAPAGAGAASLDLMASSGEEAAATAATTLRILLDHVAGPFPSVAYLLLGAVGEGLQPAGASGERQSVAALEPWKGHSCLRVLWTQVERKRRRKRRRRRRRKRKRKRCPISLQIGLLRNDSPFLSPSGPLSCGPRGRSLGAFPHRLHRSAGPVRGLPGAPLRGSRGARHRSGARPWPILSGLRCRGWTWRMTSLPLPDD